jgi:hypothetical protein
MSHSEQTWQSLSIATVAYGISSGRRATHHRSPLTFLFVGHAQNSVVKSDSGHCNRPSIGIIIFPLSTGCSFTPARCNPDVAGTVPASGIGLSSAGRRYFTHA